MKPFPRPGLYAITDATLQPSGRLKQVVEASISGGAVAIQYRDKGVSDARRRREASELLALCRSRGVPFIINDDIHLAQAVGADGVHVGKDDCTIESAREALGVKFIIGISCYDSAQRALDAQRLGASYIAYGSFYPSNTKRDATRATTKLLRETRAQLHIPIVAIGGITPQNGAPLLDAGADLLAAIHGVFGSTDPKAAAKAYAALFKAKERNV